MSNVNTRRVDYCLHSLVFQALLLFFELAIIDIEASERVKDT